MIKVKIQIWQARLSQNTQRTFLSPISYLQSTYSVQNMYKRPSCNFFLSNMQCLLRILLCCRNSITPTISVLRLSAISKGKTFLSHFPMNPLDQIYKLVNCWMIEKSKGSIPAPKQMNFRKSSKRPLTLPPSFSENHVADLFRNS